MRQTSASGPGANLIGTLPAAARPKRNVFTIVHTFAGTYADLAIASSGQIQLIDPEPPEVKDYTFVSLEGITFQRSPGIAVHGLPLNTLNWSVSAGFSSTRPAWYADASGIVHLQGAAMQILASGPGRNLIGTPPPV